MKLSKNFTLEEFTVSQEAARSGLKNVPNEKQIVSLEALCENILQPLRDKVRKPVVVTSGYRSPTINRRIGGSVSSQHCQGQAADFIIPGMTTVEVVNLIRKMELPYDQLIEEFGRWVHVSFGPRHRHQTLKAIYQGGKVLYKEI